MKLIKISDTTLINPEHITSIECTKITYRRDGKQAMLVIRMHDDESHYLYETDYVDEAPFCSFLWIMQQLETS